jgi:GT2 family glycosyltransferase
MKVSVIIPNYNGRHLLKQHLPAVLATKPDEIIVVDDASTDTSIEFITANWPQIKLIQLPDNLGFARAVNAGVAAAAGDIVVLFNNDVAPRQNCLVNLDSQFLAQPKLFSLGFLEIDPGTNIQRGKAIGFWHRGLVRHAPAPDLEAGPTFWTFAAAAAYRKSMWNKLGGLDPLFRPAYWEDIDLSYRAQQQGWSVYFDPSRQVLHAAESTMKPVLGSRLKHIAFKNQLLFVWKNITDARRLRSHLFWLPYNIMFDLLGFILALVQLPEALKQRHETILGSTSGR